MKRLITVVFAGLFATSTASQTIPETPPPGLFAPADMADLSEDDPAFRVQMELLQEQPQDLLERDVIVLTDTDPAARSALRLKMRPRGFMLVLVGKDGGIKLRKPRPWDVREITRSIDKTTIRQREIRENKEKAGKIFD